MLHRCYGLAPRTRLMEAGGRTFLHCTYPLRRIEVNRSAWLVLQVLDGVTPLEALVTAYDRSLLALLEHLVNLGLLRASYRVSAPTRWPQVTVIVPVFGNPEGLRRCLAALAALDYPRERYTVRVIDDATPFSLLDALRGDDLGGMSVSWMHLAANLGPGEARNAGAGIFAQALPPGLPSLRPSAEILAFTDSDCVPDPAWLSSLVGALEDTSIAAVGGRVAGLSRRGLLARYEGDWASLYMGEEGGEAGLPGAPIAYLPACNLLVKRSVFETLGGFRPGMRLGEDVDFCWRLAAAGQGLYYHPQGTVQHDYRRCWLPFLQRKRAYARSEASLRQHHPSRFFPPPGQRAFLLTVLLLASALLLDHPLPLVLAILPLPLSRLLLLGRQRGERMELWGMMGALLRSLGGIGLAHARWYARRSLVLWVLPLLLFPRLLPLALLLLGGASLAEWRARPRSSASPWVFLLGFWGECLGYSTGWLQGCCAALGQSFRKKRP